MKHQRPWEAVFVDEVSRSLILETDENSGLRESVGCRRSLRDFRKIGALCEAFGAVCYYAPGEFRL